MCSCVEMNKEHCQQLTKADKQDQGCAWLWEELVFQRLPFVVELYWTMDAGNNSAMIIIMLSCSITCNVNDIRYGVH